MAFGPRNPYGEPTRPSGPLSILTGLLQGVGNYFQAKQQTQKQDQQNEVLKGQKDEQEYNKKLRAVQPYSNALRDEARNEANPERRAALLSRAADIDTFKIDPSQYTATPQPAVNYGGTAAPPSSTATPAPPPSADLSQDLLSRFPGHAAAPTTGAAPALTNPLAHLLTSPNFQTIAPSEQGVGAAVPQVAPPNADDLLRQRLNPAGDSLRQKFAQQVRSSLETPTATTNAKGQTSTAGGSLRQKFAQQARASLETPTATTNAKGQTSTAGGSPNLAWGVNLPATQTLFGGLPKGMTIEQQKEQAAADRLKLTLQQKSDLAKDNAALRMLAISTRSEDRQASDWIKYVIDGEANGLMSREQAEAAADRRFGSRTGQAARAVRNGIPLGRVLEESGTIPMGLGGSAPQGGTIPNPNSPGGFPTESGGTPPTPSGTAPYPVPGQQPFTSPTGMPEIAPPPPTSESAGPTFQPPGAAPYVPGGPVAGGWEPGLPAPATAGEGGANEAPLQTPPRFTLPTAPATPNPLAGNTTDPLRAMFAQMMGLTPQGPTTTEEGAPLTVDKGAERELPPVSPEPPLPETPVGAGSEGAPGAPGAAPAEPMTKAQREQARKDLEQERKGADSQSRRDVNQARVPLLQAQTALAQQRAKQIETLLPLTVEERHAKIEKTKGLDPVSKADIALKLAQADAATKNATTRQKQQSVQEALGYLQVGIGEMRNKLAAAKLDQESKQFYEKELDTLVAKKAEVAQRVQSSFQDPNKLKELADLATTLDQKIAAGAPPPPSAGITGATGGGTSTGAGTPGVTGTGQRIYSMGKPLDYQVQGQVFNRGLFTAVRGFVKSGDMQKVYQMFPNHKAEADAYINSARQSLNGR